MSDITEVTQDERRLYEIARRLYGMVESLHCSGYDMARCADECPQHISDDECGLTRIFDELEPIGERLQREGR